MLGNHQETMTLFRRGYIGCVAQHTEQHILSGMTGIHLLIGVVDKSIIHDVRAF